jgi:hypothetical protein
MPDFFPDIQYLFVQDRCFSFKSALTRLPLDSKVQCMTDNRMSGAALIAGMIASIITMAFHPTAHDVMGPDHSASIAMQVNIAVHTLALLFIPIIFLGAFGLTQRLASPNRLALSALVFLGFAEVAIMIAAAASGLIATGLYHHMLADPSTADSWRPVLQLNGHINQAFALIYAVASSFAIVLWSAAILRSNIFSRTLGIFGCFLGPITILAVVSGHIRLNVHGFGAIVLGQAIWFISAGVLLWREKNPTRAIVA